MGEESDRCSFARPFPPGFSDCPTFEGVPFSSADSNNRPLKSALTCRHLAVGASEQPGSFYPRCTLGSAADRLRVAAARASEHLDQVS